MRKQKSDLLIYIAGGDLSYASPFRDIGTITIDKEDLTGADLVVFTGGEDVTPTLYGEEPHPFSSWNWKRDQYEKEIFEIAAFHRIPMVGICRGLQFLHVMNGGKLIQHVEQHPYPFHSVITEDGDIIQTNTLHHQACQNQPELMEVIATSFPDSSVEAASYPQTRCFGVQYHPEMHSCPADGAAWFQNKVKELLGISTQEEKIKCAMH